MQGNPWRFENTNFSFSGGMGLNSQVMSKEVTIRRQCKFIKIFVFGSSWSCNLFALFSYLEHIALCVCSAEFPCDISLSLWWEPQCRERFSEARILAVRLGNEIFDRALLNRVSLFHLQAKYEANRRKHELPLVTKHPPMENNIKKNHIHYHLVWGKLK